MNPNTSQMMETKIPTNEGPKTTGEILDHLSWGSYAANRGYGMTHEQLGRLGIGNEAMRKRYDELQAARIEAEKAIAKEQEIQREAHDQFVDSIRQAFGTPCRTKSNAA